MKYAESNQRIEEMRKQITAIRAEMKTLQAEIEPQEVQDFTTPEGERPLSSLFGDKDDLIVIHNMGKSCAYCTLWADGYNGVYEHLANRAAFVITSPDAPEVQREFAKSRGWRFPMASHRGTPFAADMGYFSEQKGCAPGVSAFRREGKKIFRVRDTGLGPYDDFCSVWHLFGLLPQGAEGWRPKFSYAAVGGVTV